MMDSQPEIELQEEKTSQVSLYTKYLSVRTPLLFIFVGILLIGGGVLFYLLSQDRPFNGFAPSEEFLDVFEGTRVYVSLVPEDSDGYSQIYTFDIESQEDVELVTLSNSPGLNAFFHMSPNQHSGVFVSFFGDNRQLYKLDIQSGESKLLTESSAFLKRHPQWSPDGSAVAFMAQPEYVWDDELPLLPEDYSVYVTDLEGNEKVIAEGAYPHWTPEGDLIFLKVDGIHLYRMDTGESERIWEVVNGNANVAMSLDVSPDGKHIVWATPDKDTVAFLEVDSWDPFVGDVNKRIHNVKGYWPVFSEDGSYVVMQVAKGDIKDNTSAHELVAYSLKSLMPESLYDLDAFKLRATAITDWRIIDKDNDAVRR